MALSNREQNETHKIHSDSKFFIKSIIFKLIKLEIWARDGEQLTRDCKGSHFVDE